MSDTDVVDRAGGGDLAPGDPRTGSPDAWERADAALELELQLWTIRTTLRARARLVPRGLLAFLGRT